MNNPATIGRTAVISEFAADLRALRDSAGTPSFREMSGRSSAISHTTLHEAAQGNRLPSWPTTAEFVKACGADPADFRERWRRADEAVRAAARTPEAVPVVAPAPPAPPAELPDVTPLELADLPSDAPPAPPRWRRFAPGLAAAGIAVVAAIVVVIAASGGDGRASSGPRPGAAPVAADCPIHQQNPPPAPPATQGDSGAFIADITLPDCSHIARGHTAVKIWRFKNVGTVPWVGYTMHRLELPERRDQCQTIADVPIADTRPGQMVDVRTAITAPTTAGFCFVRFQLVNGDGQVAFPGGRPVNFQVVVD